MSWNQRKYLKAIQLAHYDFVMGYENMDSLYREFLLMIEVEDYERAKGIAEFAKAKGFDFAGMANNEIGVKREYAETH